MTRGWEKRSPSPWPPSAAPLPGTVTQAQWGPLAKTAAKPERTRCSRKDMSCIFQLRPILQGDARPTAAPTPGQARRSAEPRRPPPQTAAAGEMGCFHSRVLGRRLSGLWLLALASATVFRRGKCASPSKMASSVETNPSPDSPSGVGVSMHPAHLAEAPQGGRAETAADLSSTREKPREGWQRWDPYLALATLLVVLKWWPEKKIIKK